MIFTIFKKAGILILMASILLFNSCASILNTRYQRVEIQKDSDAELLIDGQEPRIKNGKYLIRRDLKPKQLTLKKEGFKDKNVAILQYKRPWLYYMSWFPFGIAYLLPPIFDNGKKAYNYDQEIKIGGNKASLPERDSSAKDIMISQVSVELESGDITSTLYPSYRAYIKEKRASEQTSETEDISVENTIFSGLLNEILAEKGYIDTTKKIFKSSYMNNLLIKSTIENYNVTLISNLDQGSGGIVSIDMGIKWEVLDYYKKPIYSQRTQTTSGQYSVHYFSSTHESTVHKAIKDAMEFGFIEFLTSDKVVELLHDQSQKKKEDQYEEIPLPVDSSTVASLPEAVESSVTVKVEEGHGSGFIVSSKGHIVTNYHVVSDSSAIDIVMNNGNKLPAKIVRVSKIYDLALLKIDTTGLKPFTISPGKKFNVAEEVYAIGTPTAEDLSQTLSRGIISGVRDIDNGSELIQTDASINRGNSGGAIVNKQGEVIGVVSSKLSGFGIEGVAFGIPAYEVLDRLKVKSVRKEQ